MIESSLFCSAGRGLWSAFAARLRGGWFCGLLAAFCAFCGRAWNGGLFKRLAVGVGEQRTDSAVLSRLFLIINALPAWLSRHSGAKIARGAFFALCRWLCKRFDAALALVLAVIFCVPDSYWNNLYSLIMFFALFALFLAGCLTGIFKRLSPEKCGWAVLLYFLWIFLSFLFSASPALSLRVMLFNFTGVLAVLLILSADFNVKQLNNIASALSAILLFISLYGCYQAYIGVPMPPSQVDAQVSADLTTRVFSITHNPNVLAQILILLLPFALSQVFSAETLVRKLFHAASFALGVVTMLLTYSRGGWIAMAFALLVFLLVTRWRVVPYVVILGAASVPFLPSSIFNRILSIFANDSSMQFRDKIWAVMTPIVRDNWLGGVGLGTDTAQSVTKTFYNYGLTGIVPPHFHNLYMQTWLETGLIGLVIFLVMMFALFSRSIRASVTAAKQPRDLIGAGVAGMAGLMLAGMAEYSWFYARTQLLFLVVVGLTLSAVYASRASQLKA